MTGTGIRVRVLVAHAGGEAEVAAKLSAPLREAGYEVVDHGSILIGESLVEEASKLLAEGWPVIVCGTTLALGTGWVHRVVSAARQHHSRCILPVRMEQRAYLEMLTWDSKVAEYWQDPAGAVRELRAALEKRYPTGAPQAAATVDAEARYRALLLDDCDLLNLTGMPERDRHLATQQIALRRLYVALRVRREGGGDDSFDPDAFDALELERAERRGAWAGRRPGRYLERRELAPLGKRLAVARRVVVLGDPGAGKSTLLRWLTTAYLLRLKKDPDWSELPDVQTLPDEDWLPILVRCRDLGPSRPTAIDHLLESSLSLLGLPQKERGPVADMLLSRMADGMALLLVDGLDEISDPQARAVFCTLLERIHLAFPKAPIVVTSRIVGYREMGTRIGRGFEHVAVADLGQADKDEFVRRWCALTEPPGRQQEAVADLIRDIHSLDQIERLTGNPLLLTTMALVRRSLGRLPNRRADLYEETVRVLLNWRPEVGERLEPAEALPQLEYVAYAMCHRQIQQLRFDELADLCADMREAYPNVRAAGRHTPEEFIRLVEQRTGLLVEVGETRHHGQLVPVYEFRHLTFQEYLAGTALVRGHYPGYRRDRSLATAVASLATPMQNAVVQHGSEPQLVIAESWREPLRLCVATCSSSEVDDVLTCILQPDVDEDASLTARPRVVLAAQCLADEPDASDRVAEQVIRTLVEDLLNESADDEVIPAAAELANSCWRTQLLDRIVTRYFETPALDRVAIADWIGRVMRPDSIRPDSAELRLVDRLRAQLPDLTGASSRASVLAALEVIAAAGSIVIREVEMPTNIADALIRMLGASEPMSDAAALALESLTGGAELHTEGSGGRRSIGWQPSPEQHRLLTEVLSAAPTLSDGACLSLFRLAGNTGIEAMISRARTALTSPHSSLRAWSAWLLGSLGDLPSLPTLTAMLSDPSSTVRTVAARAIGWCGDRHSFGAVVSTLDDPVVEVGVAAAAAIGQIRHPDASAQLTRLLTDDRPTVRAVTVRALGELRDQQAAGPVALLLSDPDISVRAAAVRSLGDLGSAEHVPSLLSLLDGEDEDGAVIDAAVESVSHLADRNHLPNLISLLDDPDTLHAYVATKALQRIGDPAAAPALLKNLEDIHSVPTTTFEALTSLTTPEDSEIRATMLRAVATDEPRAVRALARWLKPADPAFLGELVDAVRQSDAQLWPMVDLASAGVARHPAVLRAAQERFGENENHVGAATILCAAGIPESAGNLLRGMTQRASRVRQQIADALSADEDPTQEAITALTAFASDDHPATRATTAKSLCRVDQPEATAAFLRLLDDPVPWVRQEAVASLQGAPTIQSAVMTDALLARLADRYFPVRVEAVRVLGEASASVATNPLLDTLTNDLSGDVRLAVPEALAKLGIDETMAAALNLAAKDDPDPLVREAARMAVDQRQRNGSSTSSPQPRLGRE